MVVAEGVDMLLAKLQPWSWLGKSALLRKPGSIHLCFDDDS